MYFVYFKFTEFCVNTAEYNIQVHASLGSTAVLYILITILLVLIYRYCYTISKQRVLCFTSLFRSVIGWQTNMHRVRYILHKVEWNSDWTGIGSTK